jgi:cytochrome c553
MACHGTDGKADGTSLSLHGRSADELLRALRAYRSGERPATIMHQHARGYSDAELEAIAKHFGSRR